MTARLSAVPLAAAVASLLVLLIAGLPTAQAQAVETVENTDIGQCVCDLIAGACDFRCCCDPDCSEATVAAFAEDARGCLPEGPDAEATGGVRECVDGDSVFITNLNAAEFLEGQLCVVHSNNPSLGLFYSDPGEDFSEAAFSDAFDQAITSFEASVETTPTPEWYEPGARLLTRALLGATPGYLSLPAGTGAGGACSDEVAALFGQAQSRSCARVPTTTVAAECATLFNAANYLAFDVASTPQSSSGVTLDITWECEGSCGGLTLPASALTNSSTICSNAMAGVAYTVTYTNAFAVAAVAAHVTLIDAPVGSAAVTQTWSVAFSPLSAGAEARSGNPGYVVGLPVIAGVSDGTSVAVNPEAMLTMAVSDSAGGCDANLRTNIPFGQDLVTGCTLDLTLADFGSCADLSAAAEAVLRPGDNTTYAGINMVARWGSSDRAVLGDWVEIEEEAVPSAATGTGNGVCNDVLAGAHYEFLVARLGAVSNPQSKIVGVRIKYTTSNMAFSCVGASCSTAGASQKFGLVSTATWVVVDGDDAAEFFPPPPSILPVLPNDVFYPFKLSAAPRTTSASIFVTAACAVLALGASLALGA